MIQIAKNLKSRLGVVGAKTGSAPIDGSSNPKKSFKYFVAFVVLGAGLSVLTSYFISNFNTNPSVTSLTSLLAIVALFAFFLIFQSLLVRNFQFYLWVSLIEGVGLFTYFYKETSSILLFAGIIFVWSVLMAYHDGRRLLRQRVDFSFFRFAQMVSAPVIRAFALFLAIFYVGMYGLFGLSNSGFNFFLDLSEPFIEPIIPEFNSEMNANDFYITFTKNQIENKFSRTEQFQSLSQSQRDEAIVTAARELRNRIGEVTQTPVEADDTAGSYFYKVTSRYLPEIDSSPVGILTAVSLALIIYSFLMVLGLALRVVILVPLAWVIYQAIYGIGIVKVEKRSVEKDTINLA